MNKPSGRNSGRSGGRGSDDNKKPSSGAPRGAKRAGDSKDKPFKKFDDSAKKPYGRSESSSDRPSRSNDRPAKPYGDKKFSDKPARSGERTSKPYGDKKFDSKGDRPARPYGDRPERPSTRAYGDKDKPTRPASRSFGDGDRPAKKFEPRPDRISKNYGGNDKSDERKSFDRPSASRGAKSSYKDFESKGKSGRDKSEGFDKPKKSLKKSDDAPKKEFTPKFKEVKSDAKGGKRPRLDSSKKPTSKYQFRKDNLQKGAPKNPAPRTDDGLAQTGIRLNKFIANSGMCSRREADLMIQNGVVSINGNIMDEVGYKVKPDDVVKFDGRTIIPEKPVYLLLNKPKDYITTAEDPQGRRTVMALIQGACKERVFPVGRLDRNTTGLLLFTNDGELADKLIHPRKKIKKIYMVELDKNLKSDDLKQLREGVTLEDGPIKPDVVEYAEGPKPDKKVIGVEIHSGRNRIVRRMFEHFGYKVVKLDRVYIAGLTKKNLPRGHYRMLDPMEINMLKML